GRGAAEIGHLRLTYCEEDTIQENTLEDFASGWAIGRCATHGKPGRMKGSKLLQRVDGKRQTITAEQVVHAAKEGDPYALRVLRNIWPHLAEGICQMITLLCPRRMVIGGEASLLGAKLLFEPLRGWVAGRVCIA